MSKKSTVVVIDTDGYYQIEFPEKRVRRKPDYIEDVGDELWEYWYKEMRLCTTPGRDTDSRDYYLLGICPVSGLLMYLENSGSDWCFDGGDAQRAYANWCAEQALLGPTKEEKKK